VKVEAASNREHTAKAAKADAVMGKIYNVTFLLSLSALQDIYTVYSVISENFQVVNRMPFDRKDIFDEKLQDFEEMKSSAEPADCPCSKVFDYETAKFTEGMDEKQAAKVCKWRTLHGDVRETLQKSTYRGLPVGCLVEEGFKTRVGVDHNRRTKLLNIESVIKMVVKRAIDVVTYLHNGLEQKVYTKQDIRLIENIRRLLDLQALARSVSQHGAATVAALRWKSFLEAATYMSSSRGEEITDSVSEDELRLQHKDFLAKLEKVAPGLDMANTDIFALFLDPKKELYRWVECCYVQSLQMFISGISRASSPSSPGPASAWGWRASSSPGSPSSSTTRPRSGTRGHYNTMYAEKTSSSRK
jgi:hypothetical protein